jgi:predicted DNA-binding transcriptional regulator YafY
MKLARLHRLLKLIGLLQAGRAHNAEGLATECGVSRRTIFRDLDVLRQSGVPLQYDELRQHYRIPATYYLPPTNFTPEEALSLIVLCHELGGRKGVPFFGSARSAAVKLESSLPSRLRELLHGMADAVRIRQAPTNQLPDHQSTYDQLVEAVSQRRRVRIRYGSLTEWETIRTQLSPYRLLFSRRAWYVIGRSSLHRATRTFNVGRILDLEVLDTSFQIPRGFSIERHMRNAWHLIPEPGPDQKVVIRFEKMVAQNVAEVAWHKTQELTFNDDGSLEFRATVSGLNEISWWILGYGDQAEVLRPAKLRRMVAQRAERMVQRYSK